MKCAITGFNGNLGFEFIKRFPKINFVKFKGDLRNKKYLEKWILNNDFDFFLHFAAIVPVSKVEKEYKTAKEINYTTTLNLIRFLKKKNKPVWFFFSSSSHVYKYSNYKIKETSKKIPISKYGKLKLMAENSIKKKIKNTKIKVCIGRIFSFTNFRQKKTYFIPSVFSGKIINANTYRDFIDIRDICDAIYLLMKMSKIGTYNIASGSKINLNKIINMIQNKKLSYKNPKNNLYADITKLKNLGWKPAYNIKNILNEYKKFK
jgi:nucleoside-diphosphate-sugar epimerase